MKQFYMRNLLIGFLLLLGFQLRAADYYWVAGAGNWTDLNHWASISGGVANKSIVPGIGDDVYFDANSGLGANATVTMSTAGHSYCRNMSWTGVTTTAIFRNTGSFQMIVYGNMELSAVVRYDMRIITFSGSGNATYKMNGAVRFITTGAQNSIIVNKPGGSLTLLDGIPLDLTALNITLTTGNLNMSGNTHALYNFTGSGTAARSLDISNATLNMLGTWDYRSANGALNATGSTINAVTFFSDRYTFPKVNVSGGSSLSTSIAGTTFGELIFTNTTAVAPASAVRIVGNNTIDHLEFKGSGCISAGGNVIGELIMSPGKSYLFLDNNTINTRFQLNSPDCAALGELTGANANAKLTFGNSAVIDVRNVYIKMLTAVGSMAPISVVGIDGDDNVGWTFQPRPSGTTLYWVGGAGDWNDAAHWSVTSGGAGGACVPFTSDDVVFDANSGFAGGNNTISFTANGWCHNITWTNVAASPVFNTGTFQLETWGSIVLAPTMTVSGNLMLRGSEASTITTNGCSNGTVLLTVNKAVISGGLTFLDNVNFPNLSVIHAKGSMSMVNRTMNMNLFNSTSGVGRIIDISNATITVNYWNLGVTNVTWVNNAAGSFITTNIGFTANGLTYPKVYSSFAGTGAQANITNTTIGELVFTSPVAVGVLGLMGGCTVQSLEFKGNAELRGNNTVTNLLLAPSKAYTFRDTQTINGLLRFNSPSCDGLGEMRGGPGVINFGPSSTRDFNNVYLLNITATGSGIPIAVAGADAGGNAGFNITSSASGPRYWVGGSGNWNESAHWSTTSGGAGGACVPTVSNDVFFDVKSFTGGSSTVTISQGNAYCRNMDWTGATNAPTLIKTASLTLEIWGNVTLNNSVAVNGQLYFSGSTNSTFTSNGNTLGNLDMFVNKSVGYSLRFMDNFSNSQTRIDLRYGGLDISGRTVSIEAISDGNQNGPTSLNISNATVNAGAWEYQGANKTLQATGSIINTTGYFAADDAVYNKVTTGATIANNIRIASISADELIFTNPLSTSGAYIQGGNTIDKLEFKGKGNIGGTGNTIGTLIFSPGKVYTFAAGTNTTITDDWFGSGTPCNLTEITSASGTATITKTAGDVEFDYVRLRGITAAGITPFTTLEHSENLGSNTNWNMAAYDNSTPILGLGPDKTLCAGEFPYTIKTDGFFASPQATFAWGDGSSNPTLAVAGPGTYTVTVSYPDGCSRTDDIVITRSDVVIDPITGTTSVCVGAITNLSSATAGGVWSSSNTAVATVSTTGVVTGVAAGTADIIYTVTNGNGCTGTLQQAVTVNAITLVPAITGTLTLFESTTTALSNTTAGGIWSSSNTAVATVDASGLVTGVAGGTADISYAVTNPSGCVTSQTVTVTVDANSPARRVLNISKTADATEPATSGGFTISLPSSVNALEDITVTYTIGGTAVAPGDYATLTGSAVIPAGQNSVAIPVDIVNDAQIESAETVIVTLTAGTSDNYTYTIDGAAANATVPIADDDDVPVNRLLSVTAQLNVNEPTNTGTFTIALPAGVLAPENITVAYAMSGTAASGVDYETLSGTAIIPAGQNSIVIDVNSLDDQIIEQTKNIILTITAGTTSTAGNFGVDAVNGVATLEQTDNDYTTSTRLLAVTSNGNAAEPGTSNSFTISLPTGYVSSLPITVTYALTGTAAYGVDYSSGSATTIMLPAGQNSIQVPVNVMNDDLIEAPETVILTVTGGVASQSGGTVFTLTPDPASPNAILNITDEDNTAGNRTLTVSAQNGAEPATNGSFTVSLPSGVLASEDISVSYSIGSGTATPGTDYVAITGSIIIPAGQNSVQVPVTVIDNTVIENTETVILNVTGGASTNFSFTPAVVSSATADITDDDAAVNSTIVLLTKVSDAVEGGTNGQYRISLPPGVTSSEDISINFSTGGVATRPADYLLPGVSGATITIPAGSNEVFIDVDALTDAFVEGPETVTLTLASATSASHTYAIDPAGNGATVNIVDDNASGSTPLQVIAGTNASEPAANATFTVKLDGATTSAWPVTVGYRVSGTATSGLDYQGIGTVVIPAGQNSVSVALNVKDDKIFEPTETVTFTILSGSAIDGSTAYIFPADPANDDITVNITDNDAFAVNQVLKVVKTTDAAEPNANGSFTISLPPGYSSSANTTLSYTMSGSATRNTDYSIFTITLPANQNSVSLPVSVTNDQIIEGTETATLNLTGGTDGNLFSYTADPAALTATINLADDDNTAANRTLSAVATTDATEGGSAGSFTIKLPDGITATDPISVIYTVAGNATSGADYTALTGTATIPVGQNSVPVTVTAVNDNVIELTEAVILTITGGSGTGGSYTAATATATASLNIVDNDDIAVNKSLKVVRTAHAAEPGTNGAFSIGFQAGTGITSSEDITVNYTIAGTAVNGTDYTTLSGSVVLPAGQNSVPVSVLVKDDQFIESVTETVTLTITGGTSASYTFVPSTTPALRSTSLNITDNDNIAANKMLILTKTAEAAEPGTNGNFRISLPPNIYCQVDVKVNYFVLGSTAIATPTPNADYTGLLNITIPAGSNYVDIPVKVIDDGRIEPTETVMLTLSGTSTAGLVGGPIWTFPSGAVTMNITDDDNTPANRHLTASLGYEGTEGAAGTAGRIRFNYALGAIPSETVTINYTVSGSAVLGTDFNGITTQFSGTAQLTAAGTGGTADVGIIVDDDIIEGTEDVVVTINSVTSPNFTYTFGSPATARIFDNDNAPANLELAVTKTADAVESGATGEFTISLPGTATATENITVNYTIAGTATNGTDYTNLNGTVVIPAGQHDVKVPVSAATDQIIEATETVTMTIISGASASFSFTPNAASANATVNITDADNTPANLALSISKVNDASEPSTPGRVTFALPAGITAAQNITVSYTVSGTATEGADYAALPGTATILAGRNSVTIPVSVIDDQVIEPLETVVITLTGGSSTSNVYTGTGNVTINVSDDESTPANLVLSISKDADAAEPNTAGSFIIALPENVTATEDITVNYAASGTATGGVDYNDLGGSVVIPAGSNSISVPVAVVDDQLIENEETVTVTLSGGNSASFNYTGTGSATATIADDDSSNPANLVLAISTGTNATEPGTNGSFIIGLPAGILTTEDITLNYTVIGTASAGADYSPITGTITIPAGQNSVTVPVTVSDDQIIENTETVILALTGGTSNSFTFTGVGSATVNINDDESTPVNLALGISKGADGAEPGSNASFIISLQPGLTAAADVIANYSVSGTATSGADYAALAGSVTIPAGQNSVTVPVTVTDDQIIEATETLTLTLAGGSSGGLTFTGTGSATANITDNDSSPENLILSIVKTADAAEPATNGSFSISLPAGLTAAENITANYTVSGTANATEDYAALSGSAVIPAGQNAVTIPLMVTDDNLPEAAETLSLTLTGGTSASLSFVASGTNATATADLTDDDKRDQVITFTPLPAKTFGDPAFGLSATGGASGNPVTYTSSDPSVATVSGNTVTIVGVGNTTITVSQAGNAGYHAAADVTQVLTVLPRPNVAPTLAAIDDQQVCYTTAMQTVALSGITAGTESGQIVTLSVSSNNPGLFSSLTVTQGTAGNASLNYTINNSTGGTALITVTVKDDGGTLNGGTDTFSRTFALVVAPLPQVNITANPGTSVSKGQTIELTASGASSYSWANASGILSGQNSATLTVRPAQTTTYIVTGTSDAGCTSTQEITITVNEDYNLVANNVLTPNGDGKNDFFTVKNIDMYPNNEVRIFDRAGRSIYSKRGYNNEWDGTLNGSLLDEDTYYYIIDFGNGVKAKRGFISIVRKY